MNKKLKTKKGFSLTEVLLSMGILTVGMLFIAGVFPVGIYYTTVSTERTTAAVVADEAFAKIRLYGLYSDPNLWDPTQSMVSVVPSPFFAPGIDPPIFCEDINDASPIRFVKNLQAVQYEYYYPSAESFYTYTPALGGLSAISPGFTYTWSAICRRLGPQDFKVTVFVCRILGRHSVYQKRIGPNYPGAGTLDKNGSPFPVPVFINVIQPVNFSLDRLQIDLDLTRHPYCSPVEKNFINDGCYIVDDETCQIYRVIERLSDNPDTTAFSEDQVIVLDRDFEGGDEFNRLKNDPIIRVGRSKVWVIPPAMGGSRNPCVGVYQKVIRF